MKTKEFTTLTKDLKGGKIFSVKTLNDMQVTFDQLKKLEDTLLDMDLNKLQNKMLDDISNLIASMEDSNPKSKNKEAEKEAEVALDKVANTKDTSKKKKAPVKKEENKAEKEATITEEKEQVKEDNKKKSLPKKNKKQLAEDKKKAELEAEKIRLEEEKKALEEKLVKEFNKIKVGTRYILFINEEFEEEEIKLVYRTKEALLFEHMDYEGEFTKITIKDYVRGYYIKYIDKEQTKVYFKTVA